MRLDYSGLGWRDDEAIRLAKLLCGGHTPRLSELYLRHNAIGDVGASTLIRLLSAAWAASAPRVPHLTLLDLSSNQIGSRGMEVIAKCSAQLPSLTAHIHLHGNLHPA